MDWCARSRQPSNAFVVLPAQCKALLTLCPDGPTQTHEYCGAFHDDQALPADFKVKVPEGFRDSLKLGHAAYRDKLYQCARPPPERCSLPGNPAQK